MQRQSMPEEAHNTAMLTLTAERQELLFYRGRVVELEKQLSTAIEDQKATQLLLHCSEQREITLTDVAAKHLVTIGELRVKYEPLTEQDT